MNFATWSVRNPIPSIVLFSFLTLAGILGFNNLHTQNLPDLELPAVVVELVQPGAAPAQLETEVARKVEDAMATLQGLEHLRTTISDGHVSISAEFALERTLSEALIDVKHAIDKVRNELPSDLEEPQIYKVTVGSGGPMLIYAVAHSGLDEEGLSWLVDDAISRAALSVPGVAEFTRLGGVSREVLVTVDPVQLTALGVTTTDVSQALKRVQQDASGGRGQIGRLEQGVRTLATVRRVEDLKSLPIVLANGRSLRLDQVATVEDTLAERQQAALLDGRPAVGFQISRTKGYDERTTSESVAKVMATLEREHPGLEVKLVQSSWSSTQQQYIASMQMLIEGAILAVIVIWWFLRDWRATLVGAIALPLSIIPTFAFMAWFGFSLNTVTLLGLAVVVGILVDDAVVEVENISRHLRQGKSVHDATVEAVNEIALAVIATTATLVAVFMPTAFMGGITGLVFKQFGWTVVVAVLASLLVARLLTPMMAAWILKPGHVEPPQSRLMTNYMRWVSWCLSHRKITMCGGVAFFALSLAIIPLLPTSILPPEDQGTIVINMEMPPGTNLATSVETTEALRKNLGDIPGVDAIFTIVGSSKGVSIGSNSSAGEVRRGTVTLVLAPTGERPSQQEIEKLVRPWLEKIPGARWSLGMGSPGEKLDILLAGQDARILTATAREIERELRALPFLNSVTSTASLERPEITVRPDPILAAQQGVSTEAIGETLRIALAGDFDAALSKLNLDRRQIEIRAQVSEEVRTDLDSIGDLRVHGEKGLIPLSSVASLSIESGPNQIDRYNRERQVSISADLGGYPVGAAMEARDALPSVQSMPASVRLVEVGDAKIMGEMLSGFGFALLTGILLVYAVLLLLFKDWFQPITILSSVPLAICGAFMAMFIGQCDLGLPTLIGLVMLLGIVTKNSILLVDFAVIAQRDLGMSLHDAILDACHKRARPIVMTTVAMLAGLLPLMLGFTGDAGFRRPMAVAVIGGLITSTALSLLVVPVVFIYISRLEQWLIAKKRIFTGGQSETL